MRRRELKKQKKEKQKQKQKKKKTKKKKKKQKRVIFWAVFEGNVLFSSMIQTVSHEYFFVAVTLHVQKGSTCGRLKQRNRPCDVSGYVLWFPSHKLGY